MKKSIYFWKKILLASLFSLSIFIFAFQPILAAEDDGNDSGSLSNPGLGKRVDTTFDIAGEAQSQVGHYLNDIIAQCWTPLLPGESVTKIA